MIAIGIAATGAAIAFGLLSAPILLTIAAIGLFALAYDDLAVFFKGGDSLIGRAAAKWPRAINAIKDAINGLRTAWEWLTNTNPSDVGAVEANAQRLRDIDNNVVKGKGLLTTASASPFNAQTPHSIFNNDRSRSSNAVSFDQITINTQATDANGIGTGIGRTIEDYFAHANSQADDGIYA